MADMMMEQPQEAPMGAEAGGAGADTQGLIEGLAGVRDMAQQMIEAGNPQGEAVMAAFQALIDALQGGGEAEGAVPMPAGQTMNAPEGAVPLG